MKTDSGDRLLTVAVSNLLETDPTVVNSENATAVTDGEKRWQRTN